jgi:branched-chain amino acid transport system substrate-binding protein
VLAYVQSINDRGGINGRKINYITLDDAYSPPKAFEHARRLVENDEIAFMFSQLGTAGNSAVAKYLSGKKVPTIAIVTGATKFTNVKDYPLTTTGLVSYDTEGKIYAKYLMRVLPSAKYAILYQNDDLGRDYVSAFKAILGADFDKRVVTASYEVTEPTVDSQVVGLKSSGAQALFVAGTPKFAAQAIRRAAETGWKATIIINFPSSSVAGTLKPAGLENSVGVIVGTPNKDPEDQNWKDDEGVKAYRAFFDKYLAGSDISNTSYLTGYQQGMVLEQILKQCGDDLSRDNIIKQAKSLKDLALSTALPGVRINTSASNNMTGPNSSFSAGRGRGGNSPEISSTRAPTSRAGRVARPELPELSGLCLGAGILCMNRRGLSGARAGMYVHFFRRERRVAFRADHHGVEHVTAGLVLMHHGTSA